MFERVGDGHTNQIPENRPLQPGFIRVKSEADRKREGLVHLREYVKTLGGTRHITAQVFTDLKRVVATQENEPLLKTSESSELSTVVVYPTPHGPLVLNILTSSAISPLNPEQEIPLTGKEREMLFRMTLQPEAVLISDPTNRRQVSTLRAKVGKELIETSQGDGYYIPYNYEPGEMPLVQQEVELDQNRLITFNTETGDQLILNRNRRTVSTSLRENGPFHLTPNEFKVLMMILENPAEIFNAEQIQNHINAPTIAQARTTVRNLRIILGDHGTLNPNAFRKKSHVFIHNVSGGYTMSKE